MISIQKKNKSSYYRRLKCLTQQQAADILKTGKSNIANMEAECHAPSHAYLKLLGLTPRELNAPLFSTEHALTKQNFFRCRFLLEESQFFFDRTVRKKVSDTLLSSSNDNRNTQYLPAVAGQIRGTDVYAWEADLDVPSENIKIGIIYPVIPQLHYNDDMLVLYRETLNKFKVAKISENGTKLLPLSDSEIPEMCNVEIFGKLLTK